MNARNQRSLLFALVTLMKEYGNTMYFEIHYDEKITSTSQYSVKQ